MARTPSAGIRVLVVDDSATFRGWSSRFLLGQPGIAVVDTARNGRTALEMTGSLRPDLVLIDVAMPDMSGLEAAQRIRRAGARPRIVMMTLHDTPQYREAAADVSDGFIAKGEMRAGLMSLIATLFTNSDARGECL